MVEVFKTTVRHEAQGQKVLEALASKLPGMQMNFDLEDCDNILRIEGLTIDTRLVRKVLARCGVKGEVLP